MCVVVCPCVPAKLCERQRCIWGIQTNLSFQPQCFLKPISEIGVRCRGTVFISSTISLHHAAPLPPPLHPQHSQPFRPSSAASSSEPRQKKTGQQDKRSAPTPTHVWAHHRNRAKKHTGVQNYNPEKYTPPLRRTDKAKNVSQKMGERKMARTQRKGKEGECITEKRSW